MSTRPCGASSRVSEMSGYYEMLRRWSRERSRILGAMKPLYEAVDEFHVSNEARNAILDMINWAARMISCGDKAMADYILSDLAALVGEMNVEPEAREAFREGVRRVLRAMYGRLIVH